MTDLMQTAADLDVTDALAHWRDEFHIVDDELAYLDGNSLGMPPKRTLERVDAVMRDDWATGLISSWDHWVDLPRRVGDRLAPVLGARPGEVAVHDSTTINLYQLIRVALRLRPDRTAIAIGAVLAGCERHERGAAVGGTERFRRGNTVLVLEA